AELLAVLESADTQVLPPPRRTARRRWMVPAVAAAVAACALLAAGLLAGGAAYWWLTRAGHRPPAAYAKGALPDEPAPDDGAAPTPPGDGAAPARPAAQAPLTARDQAVEWLKEHNAFGPHNEIAETEGRNIDAQAVNGKAFTLSLGPKLVQSGRATILAGRRNDFFAFELPAG